MIRLILVALFLVLYLIWSIPVLGIFWIYKKIRPQKADLASLRYVQWAFKVILNIVGVDLEVIGEENIPKDQAVLYIGNHKSFFDIVISYSRCPGLTGYIAKDSMLKVPLLRTWMKRLYCLFLNRTDPREGLKTILTGIDYVKQGVSICIFPEGTRNKQEGHQMLPFKEGSFKIATKTGCPIIPMALVNTADVFENHFPSMKPAKVILEYGTPIYPKELPREEQKFIGAYVQTIVQEMLDSHQR